MKNSNNLFGISRKINPKPPPPSFICKDRYVSFVRMSELPCLNCVPIIYISPGNFLSYHALPWKVQHIKDFDKTVQTV